MTSMHEFYEFAVGPLARAAFGVLIIGLALRLWRYRKKARLAARNLPPDFRTGWALASIAHFLLPLNRTARTSPWTTAAGFALHVPLLLTAFFLSGHVVLVEQWWGLSWPTISDSLADVLTVTAIAAVAFLAARRLFHPPVKGLSRPSDLIVLALVALPLVTGLAAHRQWGDYPTMLTLHVTSACALLIAIPFTKLSHMALFFVSRAATGSDFGKRQVGPW